MKRTVLLLALLAAACSDDESAIPPTTTGSSGGGGAGGQGSCATGEIPLLDGSCMAVGVPPSACPAGFEAVDAGCMPILPAADCPPGQMALPGETECRSVGDCGDPPWGNIPVESDTVYVDQSYTGMTSTGSESMPYTNLLQATVNANPGAIIAIAEGVYSELLGIALDRLRVWGRCPELVTITGMPNEPLAASVEIVNSEATGSELHGVSVTGGGFGIAVAGADDVLIENVRVYDTPLNGVVIDDQIGPITSTLRASLIENSGGVGTIARGSTLHVADCVVRDSAPFQGLAAGVSFLAASNPASGSVRRSLVHRHRGAGIVIEQASVDVEACAILDIDTLSTQDVDGEGILARGDGSQPLTLSVVGTTVARTHQAGVLLQNIDGRIEDSTIVHTFLTAQGGGVGIAVQRDDTAQLAQQVSIERSLSVDNEGFGILIADAGVSIDSVWVSRTTGPVDDFGDGVVVFSTAHPALATVTRSRFEQSARAGISNFSSSVTLEQSMFECNDIDLDGELSGFADFVFDNVGGNSCGCNGQIEPECKVATTNLTPPSGI